MTMGLAVQSDGPEMQPGVGENDPALVAGEAEIRKAAPMAPSMAPTDGAAESIGIFEGKGDRPLVNDAIQNDACRINHLTESDSMYLLLGDKDSVHVADTCKLFLRASFRVHLGLPISTAHVVPYVKLKPQPS
jgi:hypothetical protein